MTRVHPLIAVLAFGPLLSVTAILCGPTIGQVRGDEAVQEKRKDDLDEADELQKAMRELLKIYALTEGEDVKCVKPPFPAAREEWFRVKNARRVMFVNGGLPAVAPPNGLLLTFRWNEGVLKHSDIHNGSVGPVDPGVTLETWFESIAGVPTQDLEGGDDLLLARVAADFIVREGAPAERVISSLETILRKEFQIPVRLSLLDVERKVYVGSGKYRFVPMGRPKDRVELYGQKIVDHEFGGQRSGDFPEFIQGVGRFIGKHIVAGTIEDAPKRMQWRENTPAQPVSEEEWYAARDPESVLKHLKEQTGLTFREEVRPIRVLFVEGMEIRPSP